MATAIPIPYDASLANGDVLIAEVSGGKTQLTNVAAGAAGTVLVSGGAGTAPSFTGTLGTSTGALSGVSVTGSGLGVMMGFRLTVNAQSTGTTALTAAESGTICVNTGTSSTTTFTLPAAAAGLWFIFVEGGDAGGELLINVQTGDLIIGKTHGAENGTGIATTAGTGIKNTAATNVKGDFCILVAQDATNWLMVSVAGVWASQ